MPKEIVGVILAGGQSRRMGKDKAFLEMGGVPLIERIFQTLSSVFSTVAIVSKESQKFRYLQEARLVQDLFEEQHALGGIYTALSHFRGKDCFVFACDLPFLNFQLIRFMMEEKNGYEVFIPKSYHGLEPLHALYTTGGLATIENEIRQGQWCLEDCIQKMHYGVLDPEVLRRFDPKELSFLNVNTPRQYDIICRLGHDQT